MAIVRGIIFFPTADMELPTDSILSLSFAADLNHDAFDFTFR
ncbi:hypothetical protein [Methanobrevibacter sp.]|nr:hypothetical protein [Methanobrevibacter sp.]MEE1335352.1 hypothetical protein [Methanobrevibacter sp.]